jgi:hypothetical protein
MKPFALALALAVATAASAAGDAVSLIQETRTRPPGKKTSIRHVAVLQNTAPYAIHGLRVTVELQDYFGVVLWARTAVPSPSSLRPGDTATLALDTPPLEAYRKTRYRFDYRTLAPPTAKPR